MTKVAITGATGHIGNVIARTLLEKGYAVSAMYRGDLLGLTGLNVSLVQGDVMDRPALSRLMEGCDCVIHCAGMISIEGDPGNQVWRTNVLGTQEVWEQASQMGVRKLIHISSVHAVHDLPHSEAYTENRPYKGPSDFRYDYSKSHSEQWLLNASEASRMELTIIRPSCVIGPFDFKPSKMGIALQNFRKQLISFIPPGGYDLVDVRDVADSIETAIQHGKNQSVYLLSGKYYTFKQILEAIEQLSQKKMAKFMVPFSVLNFAAPLAKWYSMWSKTSPNLTRESIAAIREGHPHMDHTKAKQALGHSARPLVETLRDYFTWVDQQNLMRNEQ